MLKILRYFLVFIIFCQAGSAFAAPVEAIPEDNHAGVILAYSRIGEDANPDNNVAVDKFMAHIDELTKGDYNVIALPDLITALKNKTDLPPRTIVITFEGAFKSALQNAIPVLLKNNLPFTIFYASDEADDATGQHMSWTDLKKLAEHKGVSLGLLPAAYVRLTNEEDIHRSINKAKQKYRDMIGGEPAFFAYPYGEYGLAYKKIVQESGFTAAFGLQSGVASESSDFFALPRFTITEKYSDIDRFQMIAEALPFPVLEIQPADSYLTGGDTPIIGFSVPPIMAPGLKSLSCFISGEAQTSIHIVDTRVELRPSQPLTEDHVRVNCTMPGPLDDDDTQVWRWYGMLLVNPAIAAQDDDGEDEPSSPQPAELQ